jgi:Ca2+-binding EF-hand superfamily protein
MLEEEKISQIFDQYDLNQDGYWEKEDFLKFYRDSAKTKK